MGQGKTHRRLRAWRPSRPGPSGWSRRARPTAPMRSMPPTLAKPDPARSKAGCRRRPTPILRPSPILLAWSIFSGRGIQPADRPFAQRRRMEHRIAPKAKWNIAPTGIGRLGVAFYAGGAFDAMTGENLTAFAAVPATYRLSETTRINLNAGWLWDRTVERHYLAYGLGFDWKLTETLQWTIEAFGQAGHRIFRAWSGRDFKPACVTVRTRFFRSTSSTATTSRRKRQLDHHRHDDPVSGARRQTRPPSDRPFVSLPPEGQLRRIPRGGRFMR